MNESDYKKENRKNKRVSGIPKEQRRKDLNNKKPTEKKEIRNDQKEPKSRKLPSDQDGKEKSGNAILQKEESFGTVLVEEKSVSEKGKPDINGAVLGFKKILESMLDEVPTDSQCFSTMMAVLDLIGIQDKEVAQDIYRDRLVLYLGSEKRAKYFFEKTSSHFEKLLSYVSETENPGQ